MGSLEISKRSALVLGIGLVTWACGSSSGGDTPGGSSGTTSSTSGSSATGDGGQTNGAGGAPVGGTAANAGSPSSSGAQNASGSGGAQTGSGGSVSGTAGAAPSGDNCTVGKWPAADPTATGPYEVVTENEVGPEAGEADEETGVVPKFTLFRPKTLSPGGLCHPVITWGNGTGSTPNLYRSLLGLFASHGFVVIGSNSKNVGRGDPKPMLVGVTWVFEQNEDPSSALYHHLDPTHVGATGHSQGAFATSQASGDPRIVTNVPIEGSQVQRSLHGPSMFFCGGMDDVVGCDGAKSALNAVTTLPAMYAEYLSVDHGSWMSFNNKPSVVYGAVTAWMRLHLMGDDELEPWFYGADCKLCTDTGWQIEQKNMP
jgi:hypothetical protein